MFTITIKGGTKKDRENIELLKSHLCYAIEDEMDIQVVKSGWDGRSGGDDAYFGLAGSKVKVDVDNGEAPVDKYKSRRKPF